MIRLENTSVSVFDHNTAKELAPYFCGDDLELWFNNLLRLAQHNLGIAHCIQHDATARRLLSPAVSQFKNAIGCYSSTKRIDTLQLKDNVVSGSKYWISNLHVADYGIMRMPAGDAEAYVLFDFSLNSFDRDFTNMQIGLEQAKPGTLIVDHYDVPTGYILGYRSFSDNHSPIAQTLTFHDYCFITNYLGCIIGLFDHITEYANKNNIKLEFELNKFKLEISVLKMLWQDNLAKFSDTITDLFWQRRNTQYTQSKNILIQLITLGLSIGDSTWVSDHASHNQQFRDALVFSTHMSSLYKNLADKYFV